MLPRSAGDTVCYWQGSFMECGKFKNSKLAFAVILQYIAQRREVRELLTNRISPTTEK
jgi:hypothetical protein